MWFTDWKFYTMAPVITNLDGEISYYIKKSDINDSYIDIEVVASSLRWKNFDIEFEYRPDNESEWQTDAAITFTSTNMMVGNRIYDLSASNIGIANLIRWNYYKNGLSYGIDIQIRIKVLPRIRNFGFLLTTSTISEIYGENSANLISFRNNRRCIGINKGGKYICLWVDSISIYDSLTDIDPTYYFSGLSFPTYATQINNGNYIICDTNNNRVIELSEDLSTIIYVYNITSPIFFDYDNTNSLCLITNSSGVNEVSLVSGTTNWTSTIVSSNIKSATYSLKNNDEIIISDYQNSKIVIEDRVGGITEERDSYKININSGQRIPFYHPYRAYKFNDGSLVVIEEDGKIVDFNYAEELMSSSSSSSEIKNSTSSRSSGSSILINSTSSMSSNSSMSSDSSNSSNSSMSSDSSNSSNSSILINSTSSISSRSSILINSTSSISSRSSDSSALHMKLHTFGFNTYGELGDGTRIDKSSPILIGSATDWTSISAGSEHSLGIRSGKLYAWGDNYFGQLGNGTRTGRSSPILIGSNADWTAISGGGNHSLGIRGGQLYSWGTNNYGELGDGTVNYAGLGVWSPILIGSATDWTVISTGGNHSLGIRGGQLYAWGLNQYGQLGDGTSTDRSSPVLIGSNADWTAIACGHLYSLGVRGGQLYAWGANDVGQLGDGTFGWYNFKSSPILIGSAVNWQAISAGYEHSLGIRGGQLYSWGKNQYGELGDGTSTDRFSPVLIGSNADWTAISAGSYFFSLGIRGGQLYSWGKNQYGELGDGTVGSPVNDKSSPVLIGSNVNWYDVDAGANHSLAITLL